jgi:hypothetical protein
VFFFGPILLATIAAPKSPDGIPPPQSGTVAFKGVFVVLQLYNEYVSQWVIMTRKMTQTASDGTFEFTVNASEMGTRGFLTIWPARPDPQFPGAVSPLYRSNAFQVAPFADPVDESGDPRLLNVALFVDTLPNADGVTAGALSGLMAGVGSGLIPADTQLWVNENANSLNVSASVSGSGAAGILGSISAMFGITLTPDQGWFQNVFFDLSLSWYNFDVSGLLSWGLSGHEVHLKVASAIAGAGGSLNSKVLQRMESILSKPIKSGGEGIPAGLAASLLTKAVTVSFWSVNFPNSHKWTVGQVNDPTVVLVANPCIGYPRHLSVSDEPLSFHL